MKSMCMNCRHNKTRFRNGGIFCKILRSIVSPIGGYPANITKGAFNMDLQTALETIKDYCASIQTVCADCRLFWVCGYLRTTEKPPCFWDIETIMKGGVSPWENGKA